MLVTPTEVVQIPKIGLSFIGMLFNLGVIFRRVHHYIYSYDGWSIFQLL